MATDRIVRIWFQSFRYSDPKSAPAPEHHLRSPACSQAALWTSHQKWGLLCVVTSSREASVPTVRIYLIAASFQLPFRPPQHQPENQIPEHHGGGRPMSSSPQMAAPCSTLGGGWNLCPLLLLSLSTCLSAKHRADWSASACASFGVSLSRQGPLHTEIFIPKPHLFETNTNRYPSLAEAKCLRPCR